MRGLTEVWRGGVNAWECDDNGHLNTRFYVQRAAEGLAMLFALSGMGGLFSPLSATTAVIREMHIRFHREALLSASLRIMGGFTALAGTDAQAVLVMEDISNGEIKATFRVAVRHAASDHSGTAQPWPSGLNVEPVDVPEAALPRSTAEGPVSSSASLERARVLDLVRIAAGVTGAERLDAFGKMAVHGFIGAVSDGIRTLSAPLREIVARNAEEPVGRIGGAVVEFRVLHLDWPRAGDAFEIRSGLATVDGHAKSLIHWMLDPVSGRVYGSMQSIAVDFDLDRRRLIRLTAAARTELQTHCVAGLTL